MEKLNRSLQHSVDEMSRLEALENAMELASVANREEEASRQLALVDEDPTYEPVMSKEEEHITKEEDMEETDNYMDEALTKEDTAKEEATRDDRDDFTNHENSRDEVTLDSKQFN